MRTVWSSHARRAASLDAIQRWLVGLEFVLAVGAYAGAVGLLTGALPLDGPMRDVPFGSSVLAGVALGLVNGVLPSVVIVGSLTRRRWAVPGHLVVGAALMGWIVVQVAFIGLTAWLQPAMFVWGVAIFVLGCMNSRRSHFLRSEEM